MLFIESEFGIESDLLLKEFIVSAAIAGAIFGSIGAAFVNEKFGRRLSIMLSCVVFIGGAALMALARTVWELISGSNQTLSVVVLSLLFHYNSLTIPTTPYRKVLGWHWDRNRFDVSSYL